MSNAVHSIEVAEYDLRPVTSEDSIIKRAMEILSARINKGPVMNSPEVVRQYLTIKSAEHSEREVFSVMFMDSQNCIIKLVPMFFGTINQTSVYPPRSGEAGAVDECSRSHPHPQPPERRR